MIERPPGDDREELRGFAVDEAGEPLTCFYCGIEIPKARLEHDHFPVPERAGGAHTVPACIVCHDLKDRLSLRNLPTEFLGALFSDMPKLSRHTRIIIGKLLALGCDYEQRGESRSQRATAFQEDGQ